MPTVKVNDIEMYYEEQGTGHPVVLVTGLGGVGASWGPQIGLFGKEFRTIVPDHRGTGRTTLTSNGLTIRQHASDIAELLRKLKAAPAHYVGSSTGGAIGMVMAVEHPDTIRSLHLVSTWGRTDNYFRRAFEIRKRILQSGLGYDTAVEMSHLVLYAPAYVRGNWDAILKTEQVLKANPPDLKIAVARIDMIIAHDWLDRLKEIRQPTSIVVGAMDVATPVYFSEELMQHIPHAELHVIPDAGHFLYLERPDVFHRTVRDFLKKVK